MADKTHEKTDTALAKLDKKATTTTTVLLTIEHPKSEKEDILKTLATFGTVNEYAPPQTPTTQRAAFDAYGNPYDRSSKRDASRDAYGNLYNPDNEDDSQSAASAEPAPGRGPNGATHDAYGNRY